MNLVWFRNDLRLSDNPALHQACAAGGPVLAVAVLTPQQWQAHSEAPRKLAFWRDALLSLGEDLESLGIPLRVLELATFDDCPDALLDLCRSLGARRVFFNFEYPLNERRRDIGVKQRLRAEGIVVEGFHGDLILPPGSVLSGKGEPFRVFTPFSRAWRRELLRTDFSCLPAPGRQARCELRRDSVPALGEGYDAALWPAGEQAAAARLQRFVGAGLESYGNDRDYPAIDGTSGLSPYLATGQLSARQCLSAARLGLGADWLESVWVTELIWREFYRHLLVAFPGQCRYQPFRPEVEAKIRWHHRPELFDAWCRGETGFAIVDAAMHQLLKTGWMHNRLRMLTASFLTKLLGVDWRLGCDFFMSRLIDGDFASNLGGWQWSASVGADAAPYFRIFNPARQAERFDPNDDFVCHWLPELASLSARERRDPERAAAARGLKPVIDYARARREALEAYQNAG
ncbi:deoxyribodipyrimidine photo-lyase [Marinobacterium nitratireducens]|uniref:Deoxyribodipyrimidine photo-lyase n=1 Tax=Marinobacterium nitratireducens TaxID=518897 RepID=A0A917ZDB5_9GAMM|nr:deoxyribodipyrimidine photo-lyase [Marinobacterium nitratireducens]GGO79734.1 deoxyribodipyrimidine photo-lyase [Marinobacterium nitratireducens]